jgi:hypothetical protein
VCRLTSYFFNGSCGHHHSSESNIMEFKCLHRTKYNFNIVVKYTRVFSTWSCSLGFSNQNLLRISHLPIRDTHPSLFNHPNTRVTQKVKGLFETSTFTSILNIQKRN